MGRPEDRRSGFRAGGLGSIVHLPDFDAARVQALGKADTPPS
jgi:hypothetical protein